MSTWTKDCKVFVKLNGSTAEEQKVIRVKGRRTCQSNPAISPTPSMIELCGICNKTVRNDSVKCDSCKIRSHRRCAKLSQEVLNELKCSNRFWFCSQCMHCVFPFSALDNDELFTEINAISQSVMSLVNNCKDVDFETVIPSESENEFYNIDPECNLLGKSFLKCEYMLDSQFSVKCEKIAGLYIIQFNARSFNADFEYIKNYLSSLNFDFNVIRFSETRLENSSLESFFYWKL